MKFAKAIFRYIIPYDLATGIARKTKENISEGLDYFRRLRANRDPNSPDAPDLTNFAEVLEHWGIEKHQVPGVIRYLTRRMQTQVIFSLLAATGLGIYGLLHERYLLLLNAAAFFALAVVSAAANTWRIHVLTTRKFIFFKDFKSWLLS